VLGGATALLLALADGPLAGPPLTDAAGARAWLEGSDPVIASFALLRLVALGAAVYLAAVTVLHLLARASHLPRLVRVADLVTAPSVRRVLAGMAGMSLTASSMSLTADARPGQDGTATMRVLTAEEPVEPDGTATMRVVAAPVEPPTPVRRTWVVAPGGSFWATAEAELAATLGRTPTDAEVAPFWTALVEHNRSRLADPTNPDLIFAGQTFELPPPGVA
jgi:hypothetical protein